MMASSRPILQLPVNFDPSRPTSPKNAHGATVTKVPGTGVKGWGDLE